MSTDDLWGSDSEKIDPHPELPPLPSGVQAIQLPAINHQMLEDIKHKYEQLAARFETLSFAVVVGSKFEELALLGVQEPPDPIMGTFGIVANTLGFSGETVKMVAKIETDSMLNKVLPKGLLEVIETATELPIAMTVFFEMAFSLGYALAKDGSIAVNNE